MSEVKTVLITGGSRGIGEQVAYEFSRHGYAVAITFVAEGEKAKSVVSNCLKLGASRALDARLDLRESQSILDLINFIKKELPKLDVLVNNAAAIGKGPLQTQSFELIEDQIRANLEGVIKLTSALLPIINGSIVNIGSNLSFHAKPNLTVYVATKFGIRGFTKSLAKEQRQIKVYSIHPGLTATDMGNSAGVSADRVAKIVFNTVVGNYKLPSGSDILVRYYLHGPIRRIALRIYDFFKSL